MSVCLCLDAVTVRNDVAYAEPTTLLAMHWYTPASASVTRVIVILVSTNIDKH